MCRCICLFSCIDSVPSMLAFLLGCFAGRFFVMTAHDLMETEGITKTDLASVVLVLILHHLGEFTKWDQLSESKCAVHICAYLTFLRVLLLWSGRCLGRNSSHVSFHQRRDK